jgi:hypothetical protein
LELTEPLFKRFEEELVKLNLIVNEGKIIDASFVEAPRQRNSKEENARIKKEGAAPKQWEESPEKLAQKDVDARWTKKNNQTYYGYKNHTKVDSESKLISNYLVTDASVHDSQALDQLLEEKDKGEQLYADSAYTGQEEILEKYQVKDQIHEIDSYLFVFNSDETVSATDANETIQGSYSVFRDDGRIELRMNFFNNPGFTELNDDWYFISINQKIIRFDDSGDMLEFQQQ